MLTIYGRTTSINVQKVMWTVAELEIEHRRIDAGGKFGGLESETYLAMNPHRRIPTVKDGETVVWESNAIMRYLAARYGEGTLWHQDPGRRAQQDQWMDWMQTTLAPDFYWLFWMLVRFKESDRNPDDIERHRSNCDAHYAQLEQQLGGTAFLLGDEIGLADLAIGSSLYRYFTLPIERPSLPRVEAWYERLQGRPAYRENVMVSYEELRGVTR